MGGANAEQFRPDPFNDSCTGGPFAFIPHTLRRAIRKNGGRVMIYMIKVFILVAVPIFGLAGALILALLAWDKVGQYARARRKMRRLKAGASIEGVAISPTALRNRQAHSLRIARGGTLTASGPMSRGVIGEITAS